MDQLMARPSAAFEQRLPQSTTAAVTFIAHKKQLTEEKKVKGIQRCLALRVFLMGN